MTWRRPRPRYILSNRRIFSPVQYGRQITWDTLCYCHQLHILLSCLPCPAPVDGVVISICRPLHLPCSMHSNHPSWLLCQHRELGKMFDQSFDQRDASQHTIITCMETNVCGTPEGGGRSENRRLHLRMYTNPLRLFVSCTKLTYYMLIWSIVASYHDFCIELGIFYPECMDPYLIFGREWRWFWVNIKFKFGADGACFIHFHL